MVRENLWARGEDPDYPQAEWRKEVADGDTLRGYYEWIEWCREVEAEELEIERKNDDHSGLQKGRN